MKTSKAEFNQLCRWFLYCIGGIPKRLSLSDNIGTPGWTLDMLHRLARKGAITYDFESSNGFSRAFGVKYCSIKLTKEGDAHMRTILGPAVR